MRQFEFPLEVGKIYTIETFGKKYMLELVAIIEIGLLFKKVTHYDFFSENGKFIRMRDEHIDKFIYDPKYPDKLFSSGVIK